MKRGCETGVRCSACSILMDGEVVEICSLSRLLFRLDGW